VADCYQVIARNPARASENRIHDDDVARAHGFEGGLVPGVTLYAYCCGALVSAIGPTEAEHWISGGYLRTRLVAPCYEGEEVSITVSPAVPDGEIQVVASVGESVRASGSAWVSGGPVLEIPELPRRELPTQRPPASEDSLAAGLTLGAVSMGVEREEAQEYLELVGERNSVYTDHSWLHPSLLLQGANRLLTANVVMPAWLHVESEVRHLQPVEVGQRVEVRGRVEANFERGGHRFVKVQVVWVVQGGAPVGTGRHTAIWRLAPRG
jgi:acyl dehydratase